MFSNRARHRQSRVTASLATFALLAFLPTLRADSVVVFNELHYHPEGDNTALEYIEFYNQLAVDVDLSNWRIDGDVTFDFPEGTVIGAREYLVVAADPVALATQTGSSGSLGPFTGSLVELGKSHRPLQQQPRLQHNHLRSLPRSVHPMKNSPGAGSWIC